MYHYVHLNLRNFSRTKQSQFHIHTAIQEKQNATHKHKSIHTKPFPNNTAQKKIASAKQRFTYFPLNSYPKEASIAIPPGH